MFFKLQFFQKLLEIRTKWPQFCSDFQWFSFGMARNIAGVISMTDHSKTGPVEIQTSGNPNFKTFGIPIFGIQAQTVHKF